MNKLKELVDKVYLDLQGTDWLDEYPDLSEKKNIASALEAIALNVIQDFVPEEDLDVFSKECDVSYSETTFKKYIKDYSAFLSAIEDGFYNSLLMWLVEE